MKKQLLTILLSFVAVIAVNVNGNAQTLIHYWHFNNGTGAMYTPTINAIPADFTDLTGSNPRILYAEMPGTSASYYTYTDYYAVLPAEVDINSRQSQPDGNAIKLRNPSDSMYVMFYVPTTHFRNIVIKYAAELSSYASGQLQQIFDYSVDSGSTWRTSGLSEPLDSGSYPAFRLISVNFMGDSAAVNNNSKFVFRVHFNLPNDTLGHTDPTGVTAHGNNRIDNVTVEGDSIGGTAVNHEAVAAIANAAQHYTIYPNPAVNTLDVSASVEGVKYVTIHNEMGQIVFSGNKEGKTFSIDANQLSAGNYYMDIRESGSLKATTIKFVKQ